MIMVNHHVLGAGRALVGMLKPVLYGLCVLTAVVWHW